MSETWSASKNRLSARLAIQSMAFFAACYIAYAIYEYIRNPALYQNDFKIYYYSVVALAHGGNPYNTTDLRRFFPERIPLPYIYPPLTLLLFKPWAALPFRVSYQLWLFSKLAVMASLLWLWHRRFLHLTLAQVPFIVLAFNGAMLIDLEAGNISVWEQALLWGAFTSLLAGRTWPFCICTVLAAQFKISPAAFLVLLLLIPEKPQWRPALVSGLVCGALLAMNWLLYPSLTRQWRLASMHSDERGGINPATLALIRDAANRLSDRGVPLPHFSPEIAYLLVVIIVLGVSSCALLRYRRMQSAPDRRLQLLFCCLVYALVLPRFKSYSYILLLPPTWLALQWVATSLSSRRGMSRVFQTAAVAAAAVFFFAPPFYIFLPVARTPLSLPLSAVPYSALIITFAVWAFYVQRLCQGDHLPQQRFETGS